MFRPINMLLAVIAAAVSNLEVSVAYTTLYTVPVHFAYVGPALGRRHKFRPFGGVFSQKLLFPPLARLNAALFLISAR